MVVKFGAEPTEVERDLGPVLVLGEVEVTDDCVRLGPHSALAARTPSSAHWRASSLEISRSLNENPGKLR